VPDDQGLNEDDALLASLRDHPGYLLLKEKFQDSRERYFTNLAKELSRGVKPVDQRVIDEKRGMWNQGLWFFREVEKGHSAFLASIEQEEE
jgi:hypothetical protein